MFDPFLSVYKSGDECVKTFGGLEVQILVVFTGEGKFYFFSWKSILFFGRKSSPNFLPKGQEL